MHRKMRSKEKPVRQQTAQQQVDGRGFVVRVQAEEPFPTRTRR